MKKILPLILITALTALVILCYTYVIAQYILAPIFIFSYIMVSFKFLKAEALRMNKLKFLSIPTLLIIVFGIFFFSTTLFICSLLGSYVVSVGIKNWFKKRLKKD